MHLREQRLCLVIDRPPDGAYTNYLHSYLFCLPTRITVICRLGGKSGGVALIAKGDRDTSIPGAAQFDKRGFPCEQAPDTRGVAEDFIEREGDKVGVLAGEV